MRSVIKQAGLALCLLGSVLFNSVAHADTVLWDQSGFVKGQQSFVESFNISQPGKLTITLSNITWPESLAQLSLLVTSASSLFGPAMGAGSETMEVGPGMIYAHWFGQAQGALDIGVYGLKVEFRPDTAPVSLPSSFGLLLCGLGVVFGWQNRRVFAENIARQLEERMGAPAAYPG
jgi:hypothetical protein